MGGTFVESSAGVGDTRGDQAILPARADDRLPVSASALRAQSDHPFRTTNLASFTHPLNAGRHVLKRANLMVAAGMFTYCAGFLLTQLWATNVLVLSWCIRLVGAAVMCVGIVLSSVCPVDEVVRLVPRATRPRTSTMRAPMRLTHLQILRPHRTSTAAGRRTRRLATSCAALSALSRFCTRACTRPTFTTLWAS